MPELKTAFVSKRNYPEICSEFKTTFMKIFSLTCFLLLISILGFSQKTLIDSGFTNRHEAKNLTVNGKKEGKWIEFLENSENYKVCDSTRALDYRLINYKAGIPYGIARIYSRHAKGPYSIVPYVTGKINGMVLWWDNDSIKKTRAETAYFNGVKNGFSKVYNGIHLIHEIPYSNNKINGIEKTYLDDGTLHSETTYVNDKKNGTEKLYTDKAKLKVEITYANDSIVSTKYFNDHGNEIKYR